MASISIEGYLRGGSGHAYLVYKDDGGVEYLLRGGPELDLLEDGSYGKLVVDAGEPLIGSVDDRVDLNLLPLTPEERGHILIDLYGIDAYSAWSLMCRYAYSIGSEEYSYDPTSNVFGYNSNAIIGSVLSVIGIDMNNYIPQIGSLIDFVGMNDRFSFDTYLEGSDSDDRIFLGGGSQTIWAKGGNDIVDGGGNWDPSDGEVDTLILSGHWTDYQYQVLNEDGQVDGYSNLNTILVSDNRPGSPDGTVSVRNIEHFRFVGDNVFLDYDDLLQRAPTDIDLVDGWNLIEDGFGEQPTASVVATLTAADINNTYVDGPAIDPAVFTLSPESSAYYEISGNEIIKKSFSIDYEAWYAKIHSIYDAIISPTVVTFSAWLEDIADGVSSVRQADVIATLEWPYKLIVTATDSGGLSYTKSLIVSVGNLSGLIEGSNGNDVLLGTSEDDVIHGLGGDDVLVGSMGADRLFGGLGIDTVSYANSNVGVTVNLSTGAVSGGHAQGDLLSMIENLTGSDFIDTLTGDDANNVLAGLAGNDILNGNGGDDIIRPGAGKDSSNGGSGINTIDYSDAPVTVTIDLAAGTVVEVNASGQSTTGETAVNFQNAYGSNQSNRGDTLYGTSGNNVLKGFAGDDSLNGGKGADLLYGGAGWDWIDAGTDVDVDLVDFGEGGGGLKFTASGSSGNGYGITVDLSTMSITENRLGGAPVAGYWSNDIITGTVTGVWGTVLNDVIVGTSGADRLLSGGGYDMIHAGGGDDYIRIDGAGQFWGEEGQDFIEVSNGAATIYGGNDNDVIYGGRDSDNLFGDDGNDVIYAWNPNLAAMNSENSADINHLTGGAGIDTMYGGQGQDIFHSLDDGDVIYGYFRETLDFSSSDHGVVYNAVTGTTSRGTIATNIYTVIGSELSDEFFGVWPNPIYGGGGNDVFHGPGVLYGDAGDDIFYATGAGNLYATGGAGNDVYVSSSTSGSGSFTMDGGDDLYIANHNHGTYYIIGFDAGPGSGDKIALSSSYLIKGGSVISVEQFIEEKASYDSYSNFTYLALGDTTICLTGGNFVNQLHSDDFLFV